MDIETIKLMRHAIGLDHKKPKNGKYEAYRNFYLSGAPNDKWEKLVKKGYATVTTRVPCVSYFYELTEYGLDLMSAMIGVEITVED